MTRTEEQEEFINKAKKDVTFIGRARAGAGKTTIAKEVARERPRRLHTFVVFNKMNATELQNDPKRPKNLDGATFHSLCFSELKGKNRRINVDADKVKNIIKKIPEFNPFIKGLNNDEKMLRKENNTAMLQLIGLAKNSGVNIKPLDLVNIMIKYNISPLMDRYEFSNIGMEILNESDEDVNTIDFDDMIRFYALNEYGKDFLGDTFVVDEAQDNTMIRTIILGHIKEVSQVIAIGDDRQAIYAFAGADCDSLDNIQTTLGCPIMPLSVNFRCDKNIIRQAQKIVPDINYLDSKEDGIVSTIDTKGFMADFRPGDVAIARQNRVIISKCFKLIRDGRAATIQGKDFGNMLKTMVKSFQAVSIKDFIDKLQHWYEIQQEYAERNGSMEVSDATEDRFQCLKFLAESCNTVEEIDKRIDKIFDDAANSNMLKFSTAHKAKGLEWDRVFVLDNDKFKSNNPKMPRHQIIQEDNLLYIAYTRARKELYLVEDKKEEHVAA